MPAFSSGRPVGPDGNPIDSGPPPGLLAMAQQDGPAPAENQAVLDAIARTRAWHDANVNIPGSGQGAFKGNEYFEAAAMPGQSGYFQADASGNITPRMQDPRAVAQDAGLSLGGLAGSIFPRVGPPPGTEPLQGSEGVQYNVPNDGGGFFSVQDLFGLGGNPRERGGAGLDVPSIGTFGASGLSTNNWRLLGRGPGWIMRNSFLINTRDPAVRSGLFAGASNGNPASAEHGQFPIGVGLGTGASAGLPSLWQPGGSNPGTYYWPGATGGVPRWGGPTT